MLLAETAELMGTTEEDVVAKVEELRAALKEKDRELAQLNERMLELAALRVLDQVEQVGTASCCPRQLLPQYG